jgi:N-acetylglucosaminyl-diphospho-decaprenol L-rhamnosyltransferase
MKLLVVITAYRARDLTFDCLKSLESEVAENPGIKVGICDNGNEDDTAEFLNQAIKDNNWQDWAYVKTVMPNRGFSGGNNVILNDALNSDTEYDFFLLLNADTIVRPGAIGELVRSIECDDKIGIACPRLEWPDGEPQVSCFQYISPVSELLYSAKTGPLTQLLRGWEVPIPVSNQPIEMDWGSFACALIRNEVFQNIGVLDEGYFLYFDDVDYCRSARNAGWTVKYFPASRVVHLRGKSNPVKEMTAKRLRRPDYWYFSRSWYLRKFYGSIGLCLANLLWYAGRLISLLRESIGNKKPHVCELEWFDIWKGFLQSK